MSRSHLLCRSVCRGLFAIGAQALWITAATAAPNLPAPQCVRGEVANLIFWAEHNSAPVESEVQREWSRLDQSLPKGKGLIATCSVGGRSCAMIMARADAKAHHDVRAYEIVLSTQMHTGGCQSEIRFAGPDGVANLLRKQAGEK